MVPSMAPSMAALKELTDRLLPLGDHSLDDEEIKDDDHDQARYESYDMEAQNQNGRGGPGPSSLRARLEARRRRRIGRLAILGGLLGAAAFVYLVAMRGIPSSLGRADLGGQETNSSGNLALSDEMADYISHDHVSDIDKDMDNIIDTSHALVPVPDPLPPPQPLLRPKSNRLPATILDQYYANGRIPSHAPQVPVPYVDMVYLWVNASGPYFRDARLARASAEGLTIAKGDGKRFRDNGELRGAMRSVFGSLGGRGLGTLHVISGDYPIAEEESPEETEDMAKEDKRSEGAAGDIVIDVPGRPRGDTEAETDTAINWRMGQVPRWLRLETVRDGSAGVKWHFHSSIFRLPVDVHDDDETRADIAERERAWRANSEPSFNSFAIESRVGWVDGLSDNFVLANDDMFLMTDLNPTDFHHPLFGDVIRIDGGMSVKPQVTPNLFSTAGEWGGLQHASMLISQRFPSMDRGYFHHMPKALTVSLMHEASVMFETSLTEAATRGFRRSTRGLADIEMSWLVGFLRIERWREALLWSWAVAKVGGPTGEWGVESRRAVKAVIGLTDNPAQEVEIRRGSRSTLKDFDSITRQGGWEPPLRTQYVFSSMDGYMPKNPHKSQPDTCKLSISKCFPPNFFTDESMVYTASEMFAHLAFEEPGCGDCLITALVAKSGERGLSAFLPSKEQIFYPQERPAARWERTEPILPLTDTWVGVDFSLDNVVRPGQDVWEGSEARSDGGVSLRQWAIKLLSRYAFVVGNTKTQFAPVYTSHQLHEIIKQLQNDGSIAMACINDDLPDVGAKNTATLFSGFLSQRWANVDATWELDVDW